MCESVALRGVDDELVLIHVLADVGCVPGRPVSGIQAAVLCEWHAIIAQEVGVDEVAFLSSRADISATPGIELAIRPRSETKVCVVAIAVKRSLDSATVVVYIGIVAGNAWNGVKLDLLDIGV